MAAASTDHGGSNDPLATLRPVDGPDVLRRMHAAMTQTAQSMPGHEDFIRQHCAAG